MFKFNIILNDDDYLEFNNEYMVNSPTFKRILLIWRLCFPAISLLAIVIFLISKADLLLILMETVALTIASIIFFVYAKKMLLKMLPKITKKIFEDQKKIGKLPYTKESTLVFDEEFFISITPESETKTTYAVIERIIETDNMIYVFISSAQAHLLPISIFSDEAEKSRFIAFIQAKINSNSAKSHS